MHSSRPPSLGQLLPPGHSGCNGKGSPASPGPTHVSLEDNTEDENAEEEANLGRFSRLFRWLEKKQPDWCRQRDAWSLYLFPPESRYIHTLAHVHNSNSHVHNSNSHVHNSASHIHNSVSHVHNSASHIHNSSPHAHNSASHVHNSSPHIHNSASLHFSHLLFL
ncbi:hypothetical protein EYF80_066367 [Liparis tanakae]|uniref:Uncharacterized protein n=1 Tax=Liparis tanakae TaxID=230148 RepID=A0A4Z2E455_9TELE|nr:hypothetical protein EYF80_066367 [Liparis tanakae]